MLIAGYPLGRADAAGLQFVEEEMRVGTGFVGTRRIAMRTVPMDSGEMFHAYTMLATWYARRV